MDAALFSEARMLEGIIDWANFESPSNRPDTVDALMRHASAQFEAIGATVTLTRPAPHSGLILRASFNAGAPGPKLLLLGHMDTVHPVGSKDGVLRIRTEGDKLYGPGVFDMKGGNYLAFHALERLCANGLLPASPVTVMLVPDEERGSPDSRPAIEAEALAHDAVLVPEPARQGFAITGRFAFARYGLTTTGLPAHAGADNNKGRSAIRAMAQLIDQIEGRTDMAKLISYSVGVVNGGEFDNVVPIECHAKVLAVASSDELLAEVHAYLGGLASPAPEVKLSVTRGPERPLFKPHAGTMALYEMARGVAAGIGFDLPHRQVGGGSDGNFTGALKVPTLDGVGVMGDGPHTYGEHLLISSLMPRVRLMAGMIRSISEQPVPPAG